MGEFGTETGQDPLPLEWGGGDGLMRDPLIATHGRMSGVGCWFVCVSGVDYAVRDHRHV